jgi:hypothetical protein
VRAVAGVLDLEPDGGGARRRERTARGDPRAVVEAAVVVEVPGVNVAFGGRLMYVAV